MGGKFEAFTFGDPVPVLEGREIMGFMETAFNGQYYEPPVSLQGLAKSFRANPHHTSAIYVKRNLLAQRFIPHPLLTRQEFTSLALDYLVFGMMYAEEQSSILGNTARLKRAPAKYVRRGKDDRFFFLQEFVQVHEFDTRVHQVREEDINQEIYGVPEYLSALNSAWLNESATLFRRKYFQNGSHAGFILYMTDAAQESEDVDALRTALREAKGPGNFRNLFMYAPGGKKDGLQLIPVSEVAAKDEFFNIKNVTRDDVLAAHRVPPQLLGIVPSNAGGFGDVQKAAEVMIQNEILPLQTRLAALNDLIGTEVIRFLEEVPSAPPTVAPPQV